MPSKLRSWGDANTRRTMVVLLLWLSLLLLTPEPNAVPGTLWTLQSGSND